MVEYLLASISGYMLGRLGHVFGGQIWWVPHHWIIGFIIMVLPFLLKRLPKGFKIIIFLFGLGIFASDFKDFLALKTFQPEDVPTVRFWGID